MFRTLRKMHPLESMNIQKKLRPNKKTLDFRATLNDRLKGLFTRLTTRGSIDGQGFTTAMKELCHGNRICNKRSRKP